jgi:hypothetical protein
VGGKKRDIYFSLSLSELEKRKKKKKKKKEERSYFTWVNFGLQK